MDASLRGDRDYIYEVLCAQVDEARVIPKWGMSDKRVEEVSTYNWATDEIIDEIENSFFTTSEDYTNPDALNFAKHIVWEFAERMDLYSRIHKRTQELFLVAKGAAEDMLDLLNAME